MAVSRFGLYTASKLIRNMSERMLITVPHPFDSFLLANGDVIEVDKILDRFSNRVTIEGCMASAIMS